MDRRCESFAVVVWGGGTGGAAAAIQAARGGADTLLLTPGGWLGGMVSAAGVCCPDGNELSPWQTGLWGAFLRALAGSEPEGLDQNWVSCFGYRPATAEAILQDWVRRLPNLAWWPATTVHSVERSGSRVGAVVVERGSALLRVELQVLIDGSDRGDLLPLAEAPYRLGWEARELWGEPSAPVQQRLDMDPFFARQPVQSPTWVVMGQLGSDRLEVDAMRRIDPDARPPLPPPFERACEAFGLERTISYGRLPGGLVMLNWPLHGNDWHQHLERAFAGGEHLDGELAREMQAHSLAFASALHEASGGWFRLGEAFPVELGAVSPALALMPYWREGRRLVGREVVIEQQLLPRRDGQSIAPLPVDGAGLLQSIAVGNYANDHHYPGPDWPLAPKSCRWGGRWSGTPFCIPYGALVSDELPNLLAADKAFSCSHMANGATRLQPLILNIGQAAGAAAALAVRRGITPAELPVRSLQEVLLGDALAPAAVVPLWDLPWHHPRWRQRQRAALDDPGLVGIDGSWQGCADDPAVVPDAGPESAPSEPHEQLWSGTLHPDGAGGYSLALESGCFAPPPGGSRRLWPLITLEPGLQQWLSLQDAPRPVRLLGCVNAWGPWLRVSRLAP